MISLKSTHSTQLLSHHGNSLKAGCNNLGLLINPCFTLHECNTIRFKFVLFFPQLFAISFLTVYNLLYKTRLNRFMYIHDIWCLNYTGICVCACIHVCAHTHALAYAHCLSLPCCLLKSGDLTSVIKEQKRGQLLLWCLLFNLQIPPVGSRAHGCRKGGTELEYAGKQLLYHILTFGNYTEVKTTWGCILFSCRASLYY